MPRNPKRALGTRPYKNYTEENLQEALLAIRNKTLSIRNAASKYRIPKNTLHLKSQEKHTKSVGRATVFSMEEEEQMVAHVVAVSNYGFPVNTFDLRSVVKSFLDRIGRNETRFKNNLPGNDWADSFMKRHKAILTQRIAKNISYCRAATDEQVVNNFFDNLEKELNGIPKENIWNYDETNLVDDPGAAKIITKRGTKYPERIQNSSKACTSIMVCGNAAGVVAPPYVNYKAEKIWSTWTENGPVGTRYNRTRSGWFDSNSFEDWFVSLMLPILKKQEGPKAIIGDNLSTHINIEVIKQCEMNNIKFIALPPNATHLLQPLDVAYFRPMKVAWRKILNDWKETATGSRCTSVPKDQFPAILKTLWGAMIKGPDNLTAGFRKSGIYPTDRQQVLKRLPSGSLDTSISSLIGESFLEQISKKRQEATECRRVKRKKNLNVPPGKSISSEEFKAALPTEQLPVDEDQPSTSTGVKAYDKRGRPDLKTLKKKRKKRDTDSNSEEENDRFSLQDSEDSETFSEFETQLTPSIPDVQPSNFLQHLKVGDFVLVRYECELYPGRIVQFEDDGEVLISAMKKSASNWKWPSTPDEIHYSKDEIVQQIDEPVQIGRREIFKVKELQVYSDLLASVNKN